MILFCDEDIGSSVPQALKLVGCKVYSGTTSQYWRGQTDLQWLSAVGQKGWLVFSCNRKILEVPLERETLIKAQVGIVFLTSGQEFRRNVLFLLLKKWEWLETIDSTEPRPFAYYLYPGGLTKKQTL